MEKNAEFVLYKIIIRNEFYAEYKTRICTEWPYTGYTTGYTTDFAILG